MNTPENVERLRTSPSPAAEGAHAARHAPSHGDSVKVPPKITIQNVFEQFFGKIVRVPGYEGLKSVSDGEFDAAEGEILDFTKLASGEKLSVRLSVFKSNSKPVDAIASPPPPPPPSKNRRHETDKVNPPIRTESKPGWTSPLPLLFVGGAAALFALAAAGLALLVYLKPAPTFQAPDHSQKFESLDRGLSANEAATDRLTKTVAEKPTAVVPLELAAKLKKEFKPVEFWDGTDVYIAVTHAPTSGLDARPFYEEFLKAVADVPRGADARVRVGFALAQTATLSPLARLPDAQVEFKNFDAAPNSTENLEFFGGTLKELFDPKRGDQRAILVTSSVCAPLKIDSPGWDKLRELHIVVMPRPGAKVGASELDNLRDWHDLVCQRGRGSVHFVSAPDEKMQKVRLKAVLSQLVPHAP